MTATSIGITASVFGGLRWLKRSEGQIVIGAAVLDVAVASFVVLTLCCFAAQAIGLEAALGGLRRRQTAGGPVRHRVLRADRHRHGPFGAQSPRSPNREGLIVAAFLMVVSIVGKVAAGWSYISKEPTNRLVVGLGMMLRGEVGLIFLGLGRQAGILTPALEAAILLMVIGTTFLAPILLRLVIPAEPELIEESA